MATRQRRTPQAAKFAILDAAERRLHDEGPEGVRIQRIAADLGITDAAIHYHGPPIATHCQNFSSQDQKLAVGLILNELWKSKMKTPIRLRE